MDRLDFEDYEDFACEIADKYDSLEDEFGDIAIIAKYDEAKEFLRELLCLDYDIVSIELHKEEFEEYWNEYIISVNQDGVWCEKFKRDIGYINDVSSVTYVMDNCSSVVFKHIESEEVYEVCVGEDAKDIQSTSLNTQDSESTYISRSKDGTPEGFSKSWAIVKDGMTCYSSYSHYSNNLDMLRSIAGDFGVEL